MALDPDIRDHRDGHRYALDIDGETAVVIYNDVAGGLLITETLVPEALEGQGIASRMLEEMFAFARSIGCEEAWVGTEPDNTAARGLYQRFGGKAGSFVMYEYEL